VLLPTRLTGRHEHRGPGRSSITAHAQIHIGQTWRTPKIAVGKVDEYYLSGAVVETRTHGATLIRLVDDAGYTRALRPVSPPPRGWPALQDLGRVLARESCASAWTGEWQIWAGTGWAHLVSVGSHAGNEATAEPSGRSTDTDQGAG
jgi:hypothetical protein